MNVETTTADFRRAITLATMATERRNTIPILGGIKCHANGSFEACGTDLDLSITAKVKRQPGPVADFVMMSPRNVLQAVSAAGGKDVSIGLEDGKAQVASGELAVAVGTKPVDDFPHDLAKPLAPTFSATLGAEHIAALARVSGAMSHEEARYYLNGVHAHSLNSTTVRFEATDGHRLYFADVTLPDADGSLGKGVIIPKKAVGLLVNLAERTKGGVRLVVGHVATGNAVTSTAPEKTGLPRLAMTMSERATDITLASRVIDGTFPDVSRVVPAGGGKQALFKVADLRRAIRAISGHSRDVRATNLAFQADGTVVVSAAYLAIEISARMTVPCQHSAAGMTIAFNGKYLASVLNAVAGDEILFDMTAPEQPVLVRSPSDTAFTAVLMPMRAE
jgi:DNA polymerase-3 subunit beta